MKFVTSALLFLISFNVSADFSGNIKAYPVLRSPSIGEDHKSLQTSAKLQFSNTINQSIKTEVAYELTSVIEKPLFHSNSILSYRVDDLKTYLHDPLPEEAYKANLIQNLNRLNVSYSLSSFDVTIGRQPIAFGSAKSINPTDVLTPFSITSIDKEDRIGVDAINIKTPINATSLIEAGFVAGEALEKDKNAYYVRPKFNFNKYDLSLTVMNFKKLKLYGFDLQHPIMDAGSWLEVGVIDETNPRLKDFVRATTGIEYKFQSSLYLAFEQHYNGASKGNVSVSPSEFIFLQNYHYSILTSTYEITPLTIGSLQTYFNWKDHSLFSIIKVDYNLTENSYLGVGTFMGLGQKTKSEFGRYGQVYFTSIRYYF